MRVAGFAVVAVPQVADGPAVVVKVGREIGEQHAGGETKSQPKSGDKEDSEEFEEEDEE